MLLEREEGEVEEEVEEGEVEEKEVEEGEDGEDKKKEIQMINHRKTIFTAIFVLL